MSGEQPHPAWGTALPMTGSCTRSGDSCEGNVHAGPEGTRRRTPNHERDLPWMQPSIHPRGSGWYIVVDAPLPAPRRFWSGRSNAPGAHQP